MSTIFRGGERSPRSTGVDDQGWMLARHHVASCSVLSLEGVNACRGAQRELLSLSTSTGNETSIGNEMAKGAETAAQEFGFCADASKSGLPACMPEASTQEPS